MADLDRLLTAHISHAAAAAAEPPDFAPIERRGVQRRRTGAVLVAVAAAVVVAMVTVGLSLMDGNEDTAPSPAPDPTPSPTITGPPPGWPGALRSDTAAMPVVSFAKGRVDGRDTAVGGIDIRRLDASTRPEWRLELRSAPPLASTLDPARRIMEHGVVVDSDGDRLADCHIGINTEAPTPGDFRVWVKNLRTGVTDERIGPPYGIPIDFFHPAEGEDPGIPGTVNRTVSFFFLGPTAPCEIGASANFYTYAVVMDHGRDPKWDFAPDAAWLKMP
jgi:hypothetical protein